MRRRLLIALLILVTSGIWVISDASPADAAGLSICTGVTWNSFEPVAETLLPSLGDETRNFQCNLKRGAGGGLDYWHGTRRAVRQLQLAINTCYGGAPYTPLVEDGIYGFRTQAAVEYVQRAVGVDDDGEAGPITRGAMLWRWYDRIAGASYCDYAHV